MSLITRCPACGTMFKVVPDQLRISEGWVRCGYCAEIFDASAHLQANAEPLHDDAAMTAPSPLAARDETGPPGDARADSEDFESSLTTEAGEGSPSEAPDSAQLEDEARTLLEDPLDSPFEFRRQDAADAVESRAPRSGLAHDPEPDLHDLSFVRQARRQAFWRGPGVRAILLLLLLALGSLLALQVAVHDRDRLAAAEPQLRPWLVWLCGPLSCRIAPARQIDAIAIETSSFNKLRGDAYRLNFTLKNQAAMEVATPALELTLTDAQDQPLVRRVLLPGELGALPGVIGAASELSASLALAVAANGSNARIAGYRLLAFYP
ncbi:MAG: hypothetical protein JWQ07_1694 [Ramlibacter sp.]|nr:hypothetical protein [Ramlibacter sp.]